MNKMWKKQRRVAQLLYSGLGGHGGVVFGLIEADLQSDWEWSLGFLGIEPLLPNYRERCVNLGLECRYLPAIAGRPWRSWPGVWRWLKRTRPDALLLHTTSAILPAALYARFYKMPLVVIEHQQSALRTQAEWMWTRLAMRWADKIILLTEDAAGAMRTRLGKHWRDRKVEIVPNGIDLSGFAPSQEAEISSGTAKSIRIGMAARFTHNKRFDLLLDMAEELIRRRPHIKWQLTFAGDGATAEDIARSIAARNLSHNVLMEGALDGVVLADWYRSLNYYVQATDGETLSVSILQAAAAKVPVIASNAPGLHGFINGSPPIGLLAERQEGCSFADAVLRAIDEPEETTKRVTSAFELCHQRYDRSKMLSRYRNLLQILWQ